MAPHLDFTGVRACVRKRVLFIALLILVIAPGMLSSAQESTLARLSHEATPDLPHNSISQSSTLPPRAPQPTHRASLPEAATTRPASTALFVRSEITRASSLAAQQLRRNPRNAEALFVRMEAAAMTDDAATMLDAAIRLCEAGEASPDDPRVALAATRLREAAANTPDFRAVIPRIEALLADSQQPWTALHAALLQAAMDGAPGLDPYALSRSAGILTDWRIVGPLGKHPLDADTSVASFDDLSHPSYENRAVENFQFPDGRIILPGYMAHRGTFYAAAHFGSLTAARWHIDLEGAGAPEVFVDGRRVVRPVNGTWVRSNTFEALPGPHRVLVRFTPASAPLRITITPAAEVSRPSLPSALSAQELAYLLAASHYANGDLDGAARQIQALASARNSAALQFLLAEAQKAPQNDSSWARLHSLAPDALVADSAMAESARRSGSQNTARQLAHEVLSKRPNDERALNIAISFPGSDSDTTNLWAQRVRLHPSCKNLRTAIDFYRTRAQLAQADAAQHQLNGCAPESLDYAEALAAAGSHAEAARALQQLLAASPLDRAAGLMLIRELQLAGEDVAAQQAAVEWLRVSPNAENYHRLASAAESGAAPSIDQGAIFYAPYRRDAAAVVAEAKDSSEIANLLDDHVAISRPDGSVSLYIHSARRMPVNDDPWQAADLDVPRGAEILTLRILHADGTAVAINVKSRNAALASSARPGDVLDAEYIVHYAGDGGIPEHPEAFQFVFGNSGQRVLHGRFVVLTPAEQADRGTVIATGGAPAMRATVIEGMLQRVWSNDTPGAPGVDPSAASGQGLPIVRVVEQDNGWSVPSSAEHQRRIETIHPGPLPADS